MADPIRYVQDYDFSDFAAHNPSTPLPGDRLDIELANLQRTTDETIDGLKDIRRSDGKLVNRIVTRDSLSSDLQKLTGADRGPWATATVYVVGDIVTSGDRDYQCLVAHTSGDFATDLAAGKWSLTAAESAADAATSAEAAAQAAASVHSVPAGGANGQVLTKTSDVDYDVDWVDAAVSYLTPEQYGATGDGVADDATAVNAVLAAGASQRRRVVFRAGSTYRLESTVSQTGFVDVDATGAKFSIAHTGAGFEFLAPYAETVDLSGDYTIGTTTIAVNTMSVALAVGEPFKIVSDAVDGADRDSGSLSTQYRTGEWLVATDGTTSTSIVLEAPLRFVRGVSPTSTVGDESDVDSYTMSLNARIYRLAPDVSFDWVGGEFYYDDSIDITGALGAKAAVITIGGRQFPRIDIEAISRGGGSGIVLAGNYMPAGSGDFRNLTDDQANGHGGYGVSDNSFGTRFHITGGNVRHLYTSAYPKAAADTSASSIVLGMGRIVGAHISGSGYGSGATGAPIWDTHHASEDVVFENCRAENGAGAGFSARGRNIQFVNPIVRNCGSGILVFTEYQSGDTDDDLYLAKKSQDYFTSARIINADIECVVDPFTVTAATVVISGSTRVVSAGHRMLYNSGAEVHLTGYINHKVSTLLGSRTIQEQTGLGWITNAAIDVNAGGAIPQSKTAIERGCAIEYNAAAAVDALDDIYMFNIASGALVEQNGQIDAALSGDFKFAVASGTLYSWEDGGWLTFSFPGADNSIPALNVARTGLRVRSTDGTVRWDGAVQYAVNATDKLLYANSNLAISHTGSTSTNSNLYTPPQPQAAFIDAAGHYQRVEMTFRVTKGGSPGVVDINILSAGSFNLNHRMASADTVGKLVFEMWTIADDVQKFRMEAYSAPIGSTSVAKGTDTLTAREGTFNIGGGSNFFRVGCALGNAGDTLILDTIRMYGDIGGFF